jgi:hypothetical protein
VPLSLPARGAMEATRRRLGKVDGNAQSVALLWIGLDEPGHLIETMLEAFYFSKEPQIAVLGESCKRETAFYFSKVGHSVS